MYTLFCYVILTWVKSGINVKEISVSDDAEYEISASY
jgi:hypothetical protein